MKTLDQLLVKTSRTFAATIPLLSDPLREEVTVAYLLFRIADTLEDATLWPVPRKVQALEEFAALLRAPSLDHATQVSQRWVQDPPLDHAGYLELLAQTPLVLRQWLSFAEAPRERIAHHTIRTAEGMARYVGRTGPDGVIRITDLDELRDYCYIVAGIVGEMLTDLFVVHNPAVHEHAGGLRAKAKFFGEGLQLVNILKDSAVDATEGRVFVPPTVPRATVFELARQDLNEAARYIVLMQSGRPHPGVLKFLTLPLFLAWPTLDRVDTLGAGAKITRPMVLNIVTGVHELYDRGFQARDEFAFREAYERIMAAASSTGWINSLRALWRHIIRRH